MSINNHYNLNQIKFSIEADQKKYLSNSIKSIPQGKDLSPYISESNLNICLKSKNN